LWVITLSKAVDAEQRDDRRKRDRAENGRDSEFGATRSQEECPYLVIKTFFTDS